MSFLLACYPTLNIRHLTSACLDLHPQFFICTAGTLNSLCDDSVKCRFLSLTVSSEHESYDRIDTPWLGRYCSNASCTLCCLFFNQRWPSLFTSVTDGRHTVFGKVIGKWTEDTNKLIILPHYTDRTNISLPFQTAWTSLTRLKLLEANLGRPQLLSSSKSLESFLSKLIGFNTSWDPLSELPCLKNWLSKGVSSSAKLSKDNVYCYNICLTNSSISSPRSP